MALRKKPLEALKNFIPNGTFDYVNFYLNRYRIKLQITRARKTKYGDYRPPQKGQTHRISVNGNLNSYHFLLTLIHEIAHLVAFDNYGFGIKSHGDEWKKTYQELMAPLLSPEIFPEDLLVVIRQSLQNVKSSSCYDSDLSLALRQYNANPCSILIRDIPIGNYFVAQDDKTYKLLNKRRTRYEAKEISSGKHYLFPALYEVEKCKI